MDFALLILRLVVGAFFIGHGAQKLFGAFGGHGLAGTGQFFESLGLRPGRLHATAAGWAELGAGVLLVLGLMTPLASLMIIAVMTVAIITVHAKHGPWVTDNGYEYNAVLAAVAFALAGVGAGGISADAAIGWGVAGIEWALGAMVLGIVGALGAIAYGRRSRPAGTPRTSEGRFAPGETPATPPATTSPERDRVS